MMIAVSVWFVLAVLFAAIVGWALFSVAKDGDRHGEAKDVQEKGFSEAQGARPERLQGPWGIPDQRGKKAAAFASAVVLAVGFFAARLLAQTTIPLDVTWDPNPAADNVTSYLVTLTGGPNGIPPQTIPAGSCSASQCVAHFTGVSLGNYQAAVTATNEWGTSPAGIGNLAITIPVVVKNVKGKKG